MITTIAFGFVAGIILTTQYSVGAGRGSWPSYNPRKEPNRRIPQKKHILEIDLQSIGLDNLKTLHNMYKGTTLEEKIYCIRKERIQDKWRERKK